MSKMIAVTMGDPAGIGPEIIIKSLVEGALSGAPVVVVGCAQTLRRILALNITPRAELRIIDHPAEASFSPATINVIDEPLSDPQGLRPGEVQAQAGDLAFRCIRRATALALEGAVAAIATAPLNKEALHLAGHAYPGHTELLAHLTQTTDYAMVLYTEKLKVIHITTHISLRQF
ncbi:4-phospho-D-threonate 3-dehydrogenase, partial [Klebsiella pneumoniae]|nr:4-phospho-D-threonate 3-dehydrogenase [Klebsiella pneumoniae]